MFCLHWEDETQTAQDKAAFLEAQMKFTAFVTVQQMNIYWQKVLGLTYTRVNLKCYDNIPHSSILKNYKAISKTATPRAQSWQIKHFGSGQPFKFLDCHNFTLQNKKAKTEESKVELLPVWNIRFSQKNKLRHT